jgi:hypothetical protein
MARVVDFFILCLTNLTISAFCDGDDLNTITALAFYTIDKNKAVSAVDMNIVGI